VQRKRLFGKFNTFLHISSRVQQLSVLYIKNIKAEIMMMIMMMMMMMMMINIFIQNLAVYNF